MNMWIGENEKHRRADRGGGRVASRNATNS